MLAAGVSAVAGRVWSSSGKLNVAGKLCTLPPVPEPFETSSGKGEINMLLFCISNAWYICVSIYLSRLVVGCLLLNLVGVLCCCCFLLHLTIKLPHNMVFFNPRG